MDKYLEAKKSKKDNKEVIKELEKEMKRAAKDLDFEKAAQLRDLLYSLEK